MIQTYGKSGRPLDVEAEPDGEPGADVGTDPVGASVAGGDGIRDGAADVDGEPDPVPQPSTARATSHTTNASGGGLLGRGSVMSPFRRYRLRPPPKSVPKTPRMMSCPRREVMTLPPVRIAVSIVF